MSFLKFWLAPDSVSEISGINYSFNRVYSVDYFILDHINLCTLRLTVDLKASSVNQIDFSINAFGNTFDISFTVGVLEHTAGYNTLESTYFGFSHESSWLDLLLTLSRCSANA